MSLKGNLGDGNSKSLPSKDFPIINIYSTDSGIDSDTSPVASTKLTSSFECLENELCVKADSFILGKGASEKDRIAGINKAITWIKDELIKMKLKDKQLTKAMITIRSKIAEQRLELERTDTGYDSDSNCHKRDTDKYVKDRWKLTAKDSGFPTDGSWFENNKRATWAI